MAGFISWVQNNWSNVFGAVGVIATIIFSAIAVREQRKEKEAEKRKKAKEQLAAHLLALDERHRALWGEAQQRKDLKRITREQVDFSKEPLTQEEDGFMRRVIVHFETGWQLEKVMEPEKLEALAADAASFFSLPIPHAVWEKVKAFRDPEFVKFVARAIERRGRLSDAGDEIYLEGINTLSSYKMFSIPQWIAT